MNEDVRAAVAMIHTSSDELDFLLLKRKSDPRDPWSGNYAFPGGMREESDGNLYETSVRETFEECGVVLNKENFIEKLPLRTAGMVVGKVIHVQPWRFKILKKPIFNLDLEEVVSAHWIPETVLRNMDNHIQKEISTRSGPHKTGGINFEGTFLWGFTYKVLCDFLKIPFKQ
jgi:8-oxo-dGTP pyrophosphatase MutT (NUDIX family)